MNKKQPIDLITGAAGIVGTHLAEELHRMGREVRTLDLKRWPLYPPGTEVVTGDVRDEDAVGKALHGVENVYHLSTILNHDKVSPDVQRSVIAQGGETVARLATEAGARRIVVFTTTEVYGHLDPGPRSEEGPRHPLDEYGRAKVKLEDSIFKMAEQGAPVTIIRPPVIVGSRFQFLTIPLLFWLFRRNLPVPLIGGSDRIQYAHIKDVVSLAIAAANADSSVGEAFNAASSDVKTMREMMEMLKQYIGSKSPVTPLPVGISLAAMRAMNLFTSPLFMEPGQFEIMGEDYLLDVSKAEKLLGWKPEHTNIEAFQDAYDWYLCMHPYPKPKHLRPGLRG
jgi:nucleoside-diphosphate-sugar epimerase